MHHVPNIFSCRYSVRLYGDDGPGLPIESVLWESGQLEEPEPEDFPEYDAACSHADEAYQLRKEQSR